MRRLAPFAVVAVLAASAVALLDAQERGGPGARVSDQYRAFTTEELLAYGNGKDEAFRKERLGHSSAYPPAQRLVIALNMQAGQGWELDSIQPYDPPGGAEPGRELGLDPALYIFRRER